MDNKHIKKNTKMQQELIEAGTDFWNRFDGVRQGHDYWYPPQDTKEASEIYKGNGSKEVQDMSTHNKLGILIEQYSGRMPLWLAPTQVVICSIVDSINDYAYKVKTKLDNALIRIEIDLRNEKIGYKFRLYDCPKNGFLNYINNHKTTGYLANHTNRGASDLPTFANALYFFSGAVGLNSLIRRSAALSNATIITPSN